MCKPITSIKHKIAKLIKMNFIQTLVIDESLLARIRRWLYRVLIDYLIFNKNLYVRNQRFHNDDITDLKSFGSDFSLIDLNGSERSLADFKGRAFILIDGRALADDFSCVVLKDLVNELGVSGQQPLPVDVVFVSIDPENDSPMVIEKYLECIHSSFIGLRPRNELDAKKFANDFLIYLNKVQNGKSVSYYSEPIRTGLVFDKEGRLRLYLSRKNGVKNLRHDLMQLILEY